MRATFKTEPKSPRLSIDCLKLPHHPFPVKVRMTRLNNLEEVARAKAMDPRELMSKISAVLGVWTRVDGEPMQGLIRGYWDEQTVYAVLAEI